MTKNRKYATDFKKLKRTKLKCTRQENHQTTQGKTKRISNEELQKQPENTD